MSALQKLRFLFVGDLMGDPGVAMFQKWMPAVKQKHSIDAIVVNGENSSKNGKGTSPEIVKALCAAGALVVTSGNHVWGNKKIYDFIKESNALIRPANFPSACPGKGYAIIDVAGVTVAIINLQGNVFMHENLECPFRTADTLISFLKTKTNIIFIDFHAEATSEKQALAYYLDGKVSGIFGTHTHVQTADEKILPRGSAYITDLGFAGAMHSALGIESKIIIERFLTQMPAQFNVEKNGPMVLNAVCVEVDVQTGKALKVERINIVDEEIVIC